MTTEFKRIAKAMAAEGVPEVFLEDVLGMTEEISGAKTLLTLWEESEDEERDEVVADLCDLLLDWQRDPGPEIRTPRFEGQDLDLLALHIVVFKSNLQAKIESLDLSLEDLQGKTGFPLAYLKRFFSSVEQPRREVVNKIALASGLLVDQTLAY